MDGVEDSVGENSIYAVRYSARQNHYIDIVRVHR